MKRLWITKSNRWKHLLGGAAIGMLGDGWWCALLASGAAAGSLELKDKMWGGKWDWADFACTVAGGVLGRLAVLPLFNILG